MVGGARPSQRDLVDEDILQAYRTVFSSYEGKVVLDDLMKAHCVFSSTVSSRTEDMLVKEGGRNAVLRIMALAEKQVGIK